MTFGDYRFECRPSEDGRPRYFINSVEVAENVFASAMTAMSAKAIGDHGGALVGAIGEMKELLVDIHDMLFEMGVEGGLLRDPDDEEAEEKEETPVDADAFGFKGKV